MTFQRTLAQVPDAKPEMAEGFYESGKIYVVVAVLVMLLVGFFIYLFNTDRKIAQLRKRIEEE